MTSTKANISPVSINEGESRFAFDQEVDSPRGSSTYSSVEEAERSKFSLQLKSRGSLDNLDERTIWIITSDGDPEARALADRHYSRKTKGAKLFCGPGEKLVLITPEKNALFVWRKNKYRQDGQNGVECTIFRNESSYLSSELIKEAVKIARKKWPGERLFTYVNPRAIKSTDPGHCFKQAGWKVIGKNKRGNLILLEAPADEDERRKS
jgi:hypothetical protein